MANTKLKLKKSSVAGRVPQSADLDYGELAINYADGKLYYKNSSNQIRHFVDSANAITLIQNYSVDSSEVTNLIDSDYITSRVGDVGLDSASVINLVDSDYVQARQSGTIGDANTVVLNTFSGDSSTTAFTLTKSPTTEQHAIVTLNGVQQHVDAYTISGSTLTFSEAPTSIDEIEVRTLRMQTGNVTVRDYAQYVYQPSTATTVFSDSDINGDILAYDIGKLDVYYNGVKLINALDYTATNGSSITLLGDAADSGDTIVVSSFAASTINTSLNTTSLTTTDSDQAVDSFNKTVSRTAKYIVQMTQGSRYHSQEVMLLHDGTSVYMTTYSDIYTESDLGSVDADVSGDVVRLLVTPNYANTTVKTTRSEIEV